MSAVARLTGRPYYGWYVVGACNLVAVMTWGIGVFNQGVFLGYFVDRYGWSRADLSFGPTLFYVWAGGVGVVIGRLIDRRGPRPILIVGALALGAGTTTLGLAREVWHAYVGFLLLGTGYACLHTVTLGAIVSRWFFRRRARAMATATFGASIGGMILVPLNAAILDHWGGPAAGLTLAAIAMTVIVPLAVWVVKDGPEAVGQEIDGEVAPTTVLEGGQAGLADDPDWRVADAVRTPAFWAVAMSFHLTMIAQGGFLIHQVLFLQPTFGLLAAASVVSLTTIMGGVGRAGFAVAGDRWPPHRVAALMFVLQAVGLGLSAAGGGPWVLVLGSAAFGLTMGVVVALAPVVAADCFGRRSFGRIYGPIYLAIQLGSALGALVFGVSASLAGSYRPIFVVVAAALLVAAVWVGRAVRPSVVGAGYNAAT